MFYIVVEGLDLYVLNNDTINDTSTHWEWTRNVYKNSFKHMVDTIVPSNDRDPLKKENTC